MIIDSLKRSSLYPFGPTWEKAFEFLKKISPSIELGTHAIDGEKIFANVNEYNTKDRKEARFEAHRRYVDIQFLISGKEKLGWAELGKLQNEIPYDRKQDVEFLKNISELPTISNLVPDMFIAYFPEDGHMPGLIYDRDPEPVKKVVVKIAINELITYLKP